MSATLTQEMFRGSDLDRLAGRASAALGRRVAAGTAPSWARLICGAGPEAAALDASPPSITFVDGEGNREEYVNPKMQPSQGHAFLDAEQRIEIVVRGKTTVQADVLRELLLSVFYDEHTLNGVKPLNGIRIGGAQSTEGFSIVVTAEVRWQLLRERWQLGVSLTGVDADGLLTGPAGDPETIVEQATT